MAQFSYSAQNEAGKLAEGSVEAASEMDAIIKLQQKGFLVLNIREIKGPATAVSLAGTSSPVAAVNQQDAQKSNRRFSLFAEKVPASDLIFLAEQMGLLIKGGIPLLQGLKMLAQNVTSPLLRRTLEAISGDVAGGTALSAAVGKHPRVFEDLWVAMIEAGEASGNLAKSLEDVGAYLNQRDLLRSKVVTAFMYPAILIGMSIFVLIFFVVKIVPVFSQIFESFNLKLPPLTVAVIAVSKALRNYSPVIIGGMMAVSVSWKAYMKTDAGQWARAKLLLGIPIFGNFVYNMLVEQFLVNFGLLLKSGVDIIKTLTILERLLSKNKKIAHAVAVARESIKGGGTIAAGISQSRVFPGMVVQMIQMGEESGKLPEVTETLSLFYRRQIDTFIARLSSVIDPIMVLGVGVIVTVIVLAVFMPIFELTQIGTGSRG
ncbi:MAG: type II secretion system F family protein [Elusimicrobia bacterium]|nr:type II secretion system F family protein [Elusimicrobiota bacterium]